MALRGDDDGIDGIAPSLPWNQCTAHTQVVKMVVPACRSFVSPCVVRVHVLEPRRHVDRFIVKPSRLDDGHDHAVNCGDCASRCPQRDRGVKPGSVTEDKRSRSQRSERSGFTRNKSEVASFSPVAYPDGATLPQPLSRRRPSSSRERECPLAPGRSKRLRRGLRRPNPGAEGSSLVSVRCLTPRIRDA